MQAKVMNISGNIALPNLYFDSRTNKFVAVALVDDEHPRTETADSLSHDLRMSAVTTEGPVLTLFAEAAPQDFETEFRALDFGIKAARNEPGKDYYTLRHHHGMKHLQAAGKPGFLGKRFASGRGSARSLLRVHGNKSQSIGFKSPVAQPVV